MRDYCDGSHFSDHAIFSADNRALQIQLYYDEIDVCNPIGSKSGVHKLGKLLSLKLWHAECLRMYVWCAYLSCT